MCISSRLYYSYPNASNGYSCCNDCLCNLVVAAGAVHFKATRLHMYYSLLHHYMLPYNTSSIKF